MRTAVITLVSLVGVSMAMLPTQQLPQQQTGGPLVDVTGTQSAGGHETGGTAGQTGQTGWTQQLDSGYQTPYDVYNTIQRQQSYYQQPRQQQRQNSGINPMMWMMLRNLDMNPMMRFMLLSGQLQGLSGQQGTGFNPMWLMFN